MATTGTTAFNLNLNDLVEEAYERVGLEARSGYEFRTARRSLNLLLLEWANRGINLWTIEQSTIPLVAGTATYNLPTDTVDLMEHVIRTGAGSVSTQADITISRISVSTYASIPNKLEQGFPIQVMIDRAVTTPTITVWPTPDDSQTYTFVYWKLRRMDDAGNGVNTQDIPFRLLPAMVAGLAYHLAVKVAPDRVPLLKAAYDEAWDLASSEDREKAPVSFVPRVFRV